MADERVGKQFRPAGDDAFIVDGERVAAGPPESAQIIHMVGQGQRIDRISVTVVVAAAYAVRLDLRSGRQKRNREAVSRTAAPRIREIRIHIVTHSFVSRNSAPVPVPFCICVFRIGHDHGRKRGRIHIKNVVRNSSTRCEPITTFSGWFSTSRAHVKVESARLRFNIISPPRSC